MPETNYRLEARAYVPKHSNNGYYYSIKMLNSDGLYEDYWRLQSYNSSGGYAYYEQNPSSSWGWSYIAVGDMSDARLPLPTKVQLLVNNQVVYEWNDLTRGLNTLSLDLGTSQLSISNIYFNKLYKTVYNSTNVTIKGNVSVNKCYQTQKEYLEQLSSGQLTIVAGNYYKVFEDAEVQLKMNAYGDLVGITDSEFASLSGNVPNFEGNINIVSFKELVQSSYSGIPQNYFRDCTNLEYLFLPNTMTSIGYNGVRGCTKLKSLGSTRFTSITAIARGGFQDCSNLEGVLEFPNLTSTVALTSYEGGMFHRCPKITKLEYGKVTSCYQSNSGGNDKFYWCFDGNTALKIVDLGDAITSYGGYVFADCPNIEAIVIKATTPPTLYDSGYSNNDLWGNSTSNVYVPSSALSAYQASSWGTALGSRLKSIEQDYNEASILGTT